MATETEEGSTAKPPTRMMLSSIHLAVRVSDHSPVHRFEFTMMSDTAGLETANGMARSWNGEEKSECVCGCVCLNVCVKCRPQFVEGTMDEKGHFIPHSLFFILHSLIFKLHSSEFKLQTYELPFDTVLPDMADEER